ncbi:DUF3169 family protein [Streptococcus phocae subsp. salmonis]
MKKQQNSVLRFLKFLLLGGLVGGIIGGLLGAYLGGHGGNVVFPTEEVFRLLVSLNRFIVGIGLVLSFMLLMQLKKTTDAYNMVEEDDESEEPYRQLNKKHAYTSLLIAVMHALATLNILLNIKLNFGNDYANMELSILDFILYFMVIPIHILAMKRYNAIRGTAVPYFPNLKEVRQNIMALDEAELQAYYKSSFDTLLSLQCIIIPSLYIFLFIIYLLTGQHELTAILVLVFIQLYLLISSAKAIWKFYR